MHLFGTNDVRRITDRVRLLVDGALSSTRGDEYRPIRIARAVLGTANDLAGRPFCSREELSRRRARRARAAAAGSASAGEAAPVMVYFDGRDERALGKLEEILRGRGIEYRVLDVSEDESTSAWAKAQARRGDFPLVFIGGEPVGGLVEVTRLDVRGALAKRVFGGG